MRHSRALPADADEHDIHAAEQEVAEHLSRVTTPDDSPHRSAEADLWREIHGDQLTVVGELAGEPDADYLREDFNPDADQEFTFARYSEDGRE